MSKLPLASQTIAKNLDDIEPMVPWVPQNEVLKIKYTFVKISDDWRISIIEDADYAKFLSIANAQGIQRIDYIVNKNGELVLGMQHSILNNGDKNGVKLAGDLELDNNGKIIYLSNSSGHYPANFQDFKKRLKILLKSDLLSPNVKIYDRSLGLWIDINDIK